MYKCTYKSFRYLNNFEPESTNTHTHTHILTLNTTREIYLDLELDRELDICPLLKTELNAFCSVCTSSPVALGLKTNKTWLLSLMVRLLLLKLTFVLFD